MPFDHAVLLEVMSGVTASVSRRGGWSGNHDPIMSAARIRHMGSDTHFLGHIPDGYFDLTGMD